MPSRGLKVRAHAVLQVDRLAHIDDLAGGILIEVHARARRKRAELFLQACLHLFALDRLEFMSRAERFGEASSRFPAPRPATLSGLDVNLNSSPCDSISPRL